LKELLYIIHPLAKLLDFRRHCMLATDKLLLKRRAGGLTRDKRDQALSRDLLKLVYDHGGANNKVSVGEIRRDSNLNQQAAARLVEKLHNEHLIEISAAGNETSMDDFSLDLTPAGRSLVTSLSLPQIKSQIKFE